MLAILAESALRSLVLGGAVWVGLHLFRVRNPHVQMTCWAVVLIASLAMPVLMHWTTVTIPLAPSVIEAPAQLWTATVMAPDGLPSSLPLTSVQADAAATPHDLNWSAVATAIYAVVAGLLLLRLLIGLHLTWRLVRKATPLRAPWVQDADVRVSSRVSGPVTFGATILLPSNYADWDMAKRQAVLAHESAHVANRDFYLLLLAALNRAVFWFSPFAWWQSFRLAELAEMISDARALEIVDDRLSYAQILLDLVQHVRQPAGLHMARAGTIRSRIERILDGSAAAVAAGWRKRLWSAAATTPVVIASALTIAWSTPSRSIEATDTATTASGSGPAIEAEAARRLAEVPDRFKGQAPQPGSKEAVLRGVADLQNGTPNYDRMSAALASKIRRQSAVMIPMVQALGAVETIFFRGVGPGGYDIYGAKFANGSAEIRLLLAADGKVDDVLFRPDGDGTPGAIVGCAGEPGLKARGGTAPISVYFYNDTGQDMQLFELDAAGTRMSRGTVGKEMSSTVWTAVDRPWVVADASGSCMEVVLPGQRTRFNTVEAERAGGAERQLPSRTAPIAGSEEMLRQYIEGIVSGQPDYDHMTANVATYTRRQLSLNQAILNRLGSLQAVSFRGVSGSGNDIYVAHFSNGAAEWRISLNKDRTIRRIAIGPQY